MGRCEMELQNIDQASENFAKTIELLKGQLKALTMTASQGAASDVDKPVSELIKPSIFDTEEIKKVKAIMVEVQMYIEEIQFNKENKAVLDKEKAEAKQK